MTFLLRFTTVLLLCAFAGEASAGVTDENLVDGIGKLFREHPNTGFILDAAESLFWTLATISLVWTMGMHILRQDIGEVLMELTRFVIVTGIFFWVLDGASGGRGDDGSVANIINSFFELSNGSPEDTAFIDDADSIARVGMQVYTDVTFETGPATDADKIILNLLAIGTMVVLCLMAAQFLLLLVAAWMMGYAGIFLLGFGGARWTSSVAINFYKHVFAIGICMLALGFIGHQGYPLLDELANVSASTRSGIPGYKNQGLMLCVSILFLVLSLKVPQILYSVVTGSQVGLYVGSASMIGSAIGAGGAAALASMNAWSNPIGQTSHKVDSESRASIRTESVMEAVSRSATGIAGLAEPFHTRVSTYNTTVGDRQVSQVSGDATFDRGPSFGGDPGASASLGESVRFLGDASSRVSTESYVGVQDVLSRATESEPGTDYEAEMSAIMESRRIQDKSNSSRPTGGDDTVTDAGLTLSDSHNPHAAFGPGSHTDVDMRKPERFEADTLEVPDVTAGAHHATRGRAEASQTWVHDASLNDSVKAPREGASGGMPDGDHPYEAFAQVTKPGEVVDVVPGWAGSAETEAGDALPETLSSKHDGGSLSGGASTHETFMEGHVVEHKGEAMGTVDLLANDSVGIAQRERADAMPAQASSHDAGDLPDGVGDGFASSRLRASGAPVGLSTTEADMPSPGSMTLSPSLPSEGSREQVSIPDASADEVSRTRPEGVPVPELTADETYGMPIQVIGTVPTSASGGNSVTVAPVGHPVVGAADNEGAPDQASMEPVRHDHGSSAIEPLGAEMPKGLAGDAPLEAGVMIREEAEGGEANDHPSAMAPARPVPIDSVTAEGDEISNVEIEHPTHGISTSPYVENGQDTIGHGTSTGATVLDASEVESCATAQDRIQASTNRPADKPPTASHAPERLPDSTTGVPPVIDASSKRKSRQYGESDPDDSPKRRDEPDADRPT